MINKEDIKVGDLVKVFDTTHDKIKVKIIERINKLSFGLKHDWYPIKFSESQNCFKLSDEEIKKYFDEEFEAICRENNRFASKYVQKLEHISALLKELSEEEYITYTINLDSILQGIQDEILKSNNHGKE